MGLTDANYCSWNGFTVRSCCVALRTMCLDTYIATQQWEEKVCIYVCVTWSPCCTVEKYAKKLKKINTKRQCQILWEINMIIFLNEVVVP